MKKMLLSLLINFVVHQLDKFKTAIDWGKVKADLDAHVRDILPGTWFDDEGVAIVNIALDYLAKILSQSDKEKAILELIAAKKYFEAANALKDLLIGIFSLPSSHHEVEAKLALMDTEFLA